MDEVFGQHLREARQAAGLTQQELAERVGLAQKKNICDYEAGRSDPRLSQIRRFAAALSVDTARLVGEERP